MSDAQPAPRAVRPTRGRRLLVLASSWVLVVVGLRVIVLQPEVCPPVDVATVTAAADEATGWLVRNQNDDGSFLYRYDRAAGADVGGYNIVRHGGVTMSLYQAAGHELAGARGFAGALAAADRGTAWGEEHLVEAGGGMALGTERSVSTGASALWAAGLVERRSVTDDTTYDDLLAELGRFLAGSVEEDGAVSASYLPAVDDYDRGNHSIFFTGEVYWALARLHTVFPADGYDDLAARVEHYLATERDDAEDLFPPPGDHWAAYGMATRYESAGSPGLPTAYVARQLRLFGPQVRYESQRTESDLTHLTRGRRTLGAGLGTLGEGLGNLWWIAADEDRDVTAERARCVAGMLVDRQVGPDDPDPAARGAWFQFDVTQMDDQQHALSALLLTLPILHADEGHPR